MMVELLKKAKSTDDHLRDIWGDTSGMSQKVGSHATVIK